MSRLVRAGLLLLLLVPAARAQPAPDRALLDRTLDALRLDEQAREVAVGLESLPGGGHAVSIDSLALDIRARSRRSFQDDFRPDLLREALPFLESSVYARALERSADAMTPQAQAALLEALADPGSASLADSALAARYVDATGSYETFRESQRRTALALATQVPSFVAMREREGLTPEQFAGAMAAQQLGGRDDFLLGVRYQIARAPLDDVQAEIAFGESAAGQYVIATLRKSAIEAAVPLMVRWAQRAMPLQDAPASPPPPADPEPEPEQRDGALVEQEPRLIGGLEGIAAQIEYPEAARRASVEGTVFVQFVVDATGAVVDPVAIRSPDALLSEEALRVVRTARFEPGRQRGEPIAIRYILPIRFALRDDDTPDPRDDR